MREMWLTAKYEMRTTLGRRGFWLTTFLLPAAVLVMVFLPQVLVERDGTAEDSQAAIPTAASQSKPVGCVDPAGLLHTPPPADIPPGLVQVFANEAEAQAALAEGEIECYYLLSEDYLTTGRLTVVQAQYRPLQALDSTDLVTYVINSGLTGDPALARLLLDPTPAAQSRSLAPVGSETAAVNPTTAYLLPYLLMFVLYMALAMTSGFMLQSVSREKENRMAEVLLVSVRPKNLMLGKIIGLSTIGLLQVAVWLAVIFGVFFSAESLFGLDLALGGETAARVIPWTLVYFLLGYLMYSAVYGVLGVLAPTARDANQYVFVAIVPLMIPLFFVTTFAESPGGALATTLSLFPLTAPIGMVARLGATIVPEWQLLGGAAALAVLAYLFVLLAGRLFRADNLLSTRALSWSRLGAELRPSWWGKTASSRPKTRRLSGPSGPRPGSPAPVRGAGDPGPRAAEAPQPGKPRPPRRLSKPRLYLLAMVALAMIVLGGRDYAQGDSDGLYVALMGLIIAALAYWQYRRG